MRLGRHLVPTVVCGSCGGGCGSTVVVVIVLVGEKSGENEFYLQCSVTIEREKYLDPKNEYHRGILSE